jgi:hypothetical protein
MLNNVIVKVSLSVAVMVYATVTQAASIPLSACKLEIEKSKQNAREWLLARNNINEFMFDGVTYFHNDNYPCSFASSRDFTRGLTIDQSGLGIYLSHYDLGVSLFNPVHNKCVLVENDRKTDPAEVQIRTDMCENFLAAAGVPSDIMLEDRG